MNEIFKDVFLKIIGIALAASVAVGLIGVYYYDKSKTQVRFDEWKQFQNDTAEYRKEINKITDEINDLHKSVKYFGDSAKLMVGFSVSDKSDIDYIRQKTDIYGFDPVLVIESDIELDDVPQAVKSADKSWEVMLQLPSLSDRSITRVASLKKELKKLGREVCSVAFCRAEGVNSTERDIIKKAGFNGYTVYENSPTSGQTQDGTVYFNYYRIAGDDAVIEARLTQCCLNSSSMIFIFDVASVRDGSLSDEKVTELLKLISECSNGDGVEYSTVANTVESLSQVNAKIEQIEAERAKEIELLQARIEELNRIIDSMEPEI